MNFQIVIKGVRPSGRPIIRFDCVLKYESPEGEDPRSWVPAESGHRDVELQASTIKAIADGPGTVSQKRAVVVALIKQGVIDWGVGEGAEAIGFVESLIPGETWPVKIEV